MSNLRQMRILWPAVLLALFAWATLAVAAAPPGAQPASPAPAAPASPGAEKKPEDQTVSLGDYIRAGGYVGHTIIFLSFIGFALAIDSLIRIQSQKLVPPMLSDQLSQLARQGKFGEIQNLCRSIDCMITRIVNNTFSQGRLSWSVARDVMQEQGTKEVTRLYHRVGYIGFIATVAPMLGLLGTVTGMIKSFRVLGTAVGTARAEDLAVGVAEALVTTLEGLVVAIPLMFCHTYLRDRVTRIGQDAAGACERLMRSMADGQQARTLPQPAPGEAAPEMREES